MPGVIFPNERGHVAGLVMTEVKGKSLLDLGRAEVLKSGVRWHEQTKHTLRALHGVGMFWKQIEPE